MAAAAKNADVKEITLILECQSDGITPYVVVPWIGGSAPKFTPSQMKLFMVVLGVVASQ